MDVSVDIKKLFTERVTLVRDTPTSSWLHVKLSGRGLSDKELGALGQFLDELLGEPGGAERPSDWAWASIELAENAISSAGLAAMLDALRRHSVSCKCIKLYKNRIDDVGGVRLAEQVRRQASAVDEIHLSHNCLTARTLVALCMAISKHDAYPVCGRSKVFVPCWVRMEYNHIGNPAQVIEVLRRDGQVAICTADNRDDCGPWRCARAGKTKTNVPKVHLFTIAVQNRIRVVSHDEAELRQEIVRWGGSAPAPATRSAGRQGSASPPSSTALQAAGASAGHTRPSAGVGSTAPSAGVGYPRPGGSVSPSAGAAATTPSASPAAGSNGVARTAWGSGRVWNAVTAAPRKAQPQEPKLSNGVASGPSTPPPVAARPSGTSPAAAEVAPQEGAKTQAVPSAGAGSSDASTKAPAADRRPSLVLDSQGLRRIVPRQLEGDSSACQFVCVLCGFVTVRPMMTSCGHLFCDTCFRAYASDQVSKQKSGTSGPVQLIPCPQQGCQASLRKQDITLLDKADSRSPKGGEAHLLQRMRNNLRVRCVHHSDHFKFKFGKDAERLSRERGLSCTWCGEVTRYEDHIRTACPVELCLLAPAADSPGAVAGAGSGACSEEAGGTGAATPQQQDQLDDASNAAAQCGDGGGSTHGLEDVSGDAASEVGVTTSIPGDGCEARVVKHDYTPGDADKSHISLKANDVVRIFEVTESGWAAGVRLNPQTKEEEGEVGWFPSAFLFPAGYVKSDAT